MQSSSSARSHAKKWSRAAELLTTRPPVLALNFLPADRPTPERFFQFALSPEDDARAVARYVSASGRRRGVVLAPEGDWGTRVAAAFDEELRAAGGYLLGQASFGGTARAISATASCRCCAPTTVAHVTRESRPPSARSSSSNRAAVQTSSLFSRRASRGPRASLRPQLRFHLAGDIPTYTLGDAYEPHPTANQEIDGVMFPDMPWMLSDDGLSAEVREAARQAFGDSAARRGRLFAFGYDAFRIASSLQRGAAGQSPGAHRHAVASTRRDVCAANSIGCASRDGAPAPLRADGHSAILRHPRLRVITNRD